MLRNSYLFISTVIALVGAQIGGPHRSIFTATEEGNVLIISHFLNEGVEVNSKNAAGQTPLIVAASSNQIDAVDFLAKHGARLDEMDNNGQTALIIAARNGLIEVVDVLLGAGADPNVGIGSNALVSSAESNQTDVVRTLLLRGANVNSQDDKCNSALHYAAANGNIAMARLLLQKGADINAKGAKGTTPLMFAAGYNRDEMVTFLISNGACLTLSNEEGNTALMFATFPDEASLQSVISLLNAGAFIDSRDNQMMTPLMMAVTKGDVPLVRLLIARGANTTLTTQKGESILEIAARNKHWEVITALLGLQEDTDPEEECNKNEITAPPSFLINSHQNIQDNARNVCYSCFNRYI